MKHALLSAIFLFAATRLMAQPETEPNNSFATANLIQAATAVTGNLLTAPVTDGDDYFITVLPVDGTIRYFLEYNNTSGSTGADLYSYMYNRGKAQIGSSIKFNQPLGVSRDTAMIYGRAADTVYFRINASASFSYTFRYEMIPAGPADPEPNNTFAQAKPFTAGIPQDGRIGYTSVSSDDNDYFYTVLPEDGSIRYFVQYDNTSNSTGADFYSYIYNRAKAQIGSSSQFNRPLGIGTDSITVYGRSADTVYFRINASASFSYTIRYEMTPAGPPDPEPNNTFALANPVTVSTPQDGRIGYSSVASDADDYFVTVLPDDGSIRYFVQYDNTSNSTDADFYTFIYNRGKAQIGSSSQTNRPLGIGTDSITVYGRAADTVYFRINANRSFSYTFRYEMIPAGPPDPEPNNTFVQAKPVTAGLPQSGRIGYTSVASDDNDYFYTILPDDGTLRYYVQYDNTSNSTGADFYSYIYNRGKTQIAAGSRLNQPLGISTDTLTVFGQEADTVYFRTNASASFSYTFRYEMLTEGPSDPEPNNTFAQAAAFSPADTVQGRIGYTDFTTDANDYFYSVLPTDGTLRYIVDFNNTSGSTGADFYSYAYDKNQTQIGSLTRFNQPLGVRPTDTVNIYCRAADTVYFRISSSGSFTYSLRYEMIPTGVTVTEPISTLATARRITLDDTLRGRVGYDGSTPDDNDYYTFVQPLRGSVRVRLKATNTSNSAGADMVVYAGRASTGGNLFTKSFFNRLPGSWEEEFTMTCLPADSLFLRVTAPSGCFTYSLSFIEKPEEPVVSFDMVRFGNEVAFMPQLRQADSIVWRLGTGDVRSQQFPVKTFVPGVHAISLTGIDKDCGFTAVARDTISVTGIESYSPRQAGTDIGVGYFVMRVFGAGLDTAAVVKLVRGSREITPKRVLSPSTRELTAQFSLNGVDTGMYEVQILLSNGDLYTYPNGFRIFEETGDFKLVAQITGPSRVRTNRWMSCSMNITNERSRMAIGVMAFIVAPKWVEVDIAETLQKRTGSLAIKGNRWNDLTLDPDDFNQVYFGGEFNPNIDTVYVDYDDLYAAFDSMVSFDITQLYNQPLEGRVYPLYIPFINGNSTYTYRFKIRSTQSADVTLRSYTWPFPTRNNPNTGEILEYVHTGGLTAASIAELSPNPALKAVGRSAGYVDIGSQVLFAEAVDWWYGTNVADDDFYARQAIALAGEKAGDYVPYGNRYAKNTQRIGLSKGAIKNATENINILEQTILSGGRLSPTMANRLRRELDGFTARIARLEGNISDLEKQQIILGLKHVAAKNGLNLTSGELGELLFPDEVNGFTAEDSETLIPDVISWFDFEALTSFDPNAIYGNQGVGEARYIRKNDALNYQIAFENVDTARAPAQIVRVYTRLDTSKFDLAQTWLSHITIGDQLYLFEEDRKELFRDIDLRPRLDLIVRTTGKIDTVSGRITWEFISLDPATMDLTEDPIAGFLPPNVNYPEGEGSVSFRTKLKPSLPHLDKISAFADIYFDDNAPIRTNTWTNTLDEQAPVSQILPGVEVAGDSLMRVSLQGSDTESGIASYFLFVKKDDREWITKPLPIDLETSLEIKGDSGSTYSFYVVAQDSVANREVKAPVVEATATLGGEIRPDADFALFPNPSSGSFSLTARAPQGATRIEVLDPMGRTVLSDRREDWDGRRWQVDLSGKTPGLYLVRIHSSSLAKPLVIKALIQKN